MTHLRERVRALSPAATLARGYAVVQTLDRAVVRTAREAPAGTGLVLRLAEGTVGAVSQGAVSQGAVSQGAVSQGAIPQGAEGTAPEDAADAPLQ